MKDNSIAAIMLSTLSSSFAVIALCLYGGVVSAETCDVSTFGSANQVITEYIDQILIKIKPPALAGSCERFTMPRITWTIEPAEEGVNVTSVYMSPSNIGNVTHESATITGLEIDPAAVMNSLEVGILIQAPKDNLGSIDVEDGAPFLVNIAKGFTDLTYILINGGNVCDYGDDGCPQCNDLYTSEEVGDIGPTVVADLSEVNVVETNGNLTITKTISVTSFGRGIYDLTLTLPEYEGGVPVDFTFETGNSKIAIMGGFDCGAEERNSPYSDLAIGGFCSFRTNHVSSCKDCSNELVIDGNIGGYFNFSALSPLDVKISQDGGCDHFVALKGGDTEQFTCKEESVEIDATPFPCVGDAGVMECGQSPYGYEDRCACLVPLPEVRTCPPQEAAGLVASINWAMYGIGVLATLAMV